MKLTLPENWRDEEIEDKRKRNCALQRMALRARNVPSNKIILPLERAWKETQRRKRPWWNPAHLPRFLELARNPDLDLYQIADILNEEFGTGYQYTKRNLVSKLWQLRQLLGEDERPKYR